MDKSQPFEVERDFTEIKGGEASSPVTHFKVDSLRNQIPREQHLEPLRMI